MPGPGSSGVYTTLYQRGADGRWRIPVVARSFHSRNRRLEMVTALVLLAALVTARIRRVDGIQQSETLIAFTVYSKYDLEAAFSIGVETQH